ncbi:hypothetical protein [Flavobacterium sp.]|uniref:hypothetical protein n=1 Tax=Flavobacterium sp. TaxID=239 RepID=UPI003752EFB7
MSKLKSIKEFKKEVSCLEDNQLSNVFGGLTDGGGFGGGDGTWETEIKAGSETSSSATGRCDASVRKRTDNSGSTGWGPWHNEYV